MARDIEFVFALAVALLALAFVAVQLRRAVLFRRGARVACAVRPNADRAWQGGVARFDPDALRAYRCLGVGLRPYAEIPRSDLALGDHRPPTDADRRRLMQDPVVVSLTSGSAELEIAMGRSTVPGLRAWVEGRPNL